MTLPDTTDFGPQAARSALYSPESEEAALGCVLISSDTYTELRAILKPIDFYLHKHRWIWDAYERLFTAKEPIDHLTLSQDLERHNQLEEVGGPAYLARLLNVVPTHLHAEAYARAVRDYALRRRLLEIATATAKGAYNTQADLNELTADLITTLVKNLEIGGLTVPIHTVATELSTAIEAALEHPRELIGYSTGLADLDTVTGGLQTQKIFYLTGVSGVGKSRLAAQVAFHVAIAGAPVAYYSMEMTSQDVARRQLSSLSNLSTRAMLTGRIPDSDLPMLSHAIEQLSRNYHFYISDHRHWTTATLRADLARLTQEQGVKLCVIDYLEKLKDDWNGDADWGRSAMLSDRLTDIAVDLDLHLLVIQRMTKSGFGAAVARREHMSGSSQLIHDSDLLAVLNEFVPATEEEKFAIPEAQRKNMVTLIFDKVREEAPTRHVHLVKLPGVPSFGSYRPDPNASIKQSARPPKNGVNA